MSWGCIVCGQSTGGTTTIGHSFGPRTTPLCSDCRDAGHMQQTNRMEEYPIYIRIDDNGPHVVDVIEIEGRT